MMVYSSLQAEFMVTKYENILSFACVARWKWSIFHIFENTSFQMKQIDVIYPLYLFNILYYSP